MKALSFPPVACTPRDWTIDRAWLPSTVALRSVPRPRDVPEPFQMARFPTGPLRDPLQPFEQAPTVDDGGHAAP